MLRLHVLGLRMTWLRLVKRLTAGRLPDRRRVRTIAALAAIVGLVATATGIQATAASWTDSVNFAIAVSTATTTTTTTTTIPEVRASVKVTAVCKNQNTYTLRVDNESAATLNFTLRAGGTMISGPHTINGGASQVYEIPNGTSGVAAVPAGAWTNTFVGTASTPQAVCQATTTTTTTTTTSSTTTTTTQPPPPRVTSGGISSANPETVISAIVWDQPAATKVCTQVAVTGISSTAWHWAIQIDLTVAPWFGTSAQHLSAQGTGVTTILSPTLVLVTGQSSGGPWDPQRNNTPITNSQTALVTICNQNPVAPTPGDSKWYTVTPTLQPATKTEACVVVTASPTAAAPTPFFFGWTANIDLTAAKAALVAAGGTPKNVTWSPQPNGTPNYSATPVNANTPFGAYTIVSGLEYALRAGGAPATITVCVSAK